MARGRVFEVVIGTTITFNEGSYTRARIEIDHINYGLNPDTKELNGIQRSNFSLNDVCQFLMELNDMDLIPIKTDDEFHYFALEITRGKKYRLIFTTSISDPAVLGAITLYRIG